MTKWRTAATVLIVWASFFLGAFLVAPRTADADEPAGQPARNEVAVAPLENPPALGVDALLMMACAALGLLMIPAVGVFYGGMVRRKNVLSAFQQSFIVMGLIPLQWVLVGYSLSFGSDALAGFCGGFEWLGAQRSGSSPVSCSRLACRTRFSWSSRCWSRSGRSP